MLPIPTVLAMKEGEEKEEGEEREEREEGKEGEEKEERDWDRQYSIYVYLW